MNTQIMPFQYPQTFQSSFYTLWGFLVIDLDSTNEIQDLPDLYLIADFWVTMAKPAFLSL